MRWEAKSVATDKRKGPGRPLGSSPVGNPPGGQGSPRLAFRLAPADYVRLERAGGVSWAKQVILEALDQLDRR